MSRTAVFVAGISLTLLGIGTAMGSVPMPPGYVVAETTGLHPGVYYQQMVKPERPVLAHVAHIKAGATVELRVVNGRDKIPNRYADLETTGSMCRRVECLVAVNGDFMYQEQPVGGVVSGGRMLRSPDPSRPQLTIGAGGKLSAGGLPWSGSLILSNGTRIPLAGINVPPRDGVVLYTDDWGPQTAAPGRIEVVAATSAPAGLLNQRTPAKLQQRRAVPGPIPPGGVVLSAGGSAAEALDNAWKDHQQKTVAGQAHLLVESPVNVAESLGANPVVLRGGRRALPWPDDPNVIDEVHPRTLVGWNAAGDRFIMAVDGRQPSSAGLTMAEAADFLLGLGATDAVNLDGGGGTTFVVGGSLRNRPSDHAEQNPPPERVAPNALVVVARPGAASPAPPAIRAPVAPLEAGADAPPSPESEAGSDAADGSPGYRTWSNGEVAMADGGAAADEGGTDHPDGGGSGEVRASTLQAGAPRGVLGLVTGQPTGGEKATGRGQGEPDRHSGPGGPRRDETARLAATSATHLLRPRGEAPAVLAHPATAVAAALAVLQCGLLAVVQCSRRARHQPAVHDG